MRRTELRIGVADAVGLTGAELAGSLFLPRAASDGALLELLVCLHGGGYTRRYWHPEFDSLPGYSFAEHMTDRGHAVLAIDMLGMGESSRPEPESLLSRAKLAAANHHATLDVMTGLRDGRLARAGKVVATGVGHSMGGMMVITQQAAHGSFDRLAVLGWSNQPMQLGDVSPEALAATLEPGYLATPRAAMRALFYAPDVPLALIEADEVQGSTTPCCLGRDALMPGVVHDASAAIDCPVFVMHGSTDTSPDPHGEPGYFRASRDVMLMVLEDSAHCHNFATHRHRLWNRMDGWITSLPMC